MLPNFIIAALVVSFIFGYLIGTMMHSSATLKSSAKAIEETDKSNKMQESEITITGNKAETHYFDIPLSTNLQNYISETAFTYHVPYELVIAMIDVESSFCTNIVSKTDDYGLMQINSCNHEWLSEELGITDILDPEQNILAGVYIISTHLKATHGDVELALMRYNCGASGARKLWSEGIYSTPYTDKVMAAYKSYLSAES